MSALGQRLSVLISFILLAVATSATVYTSNESRPEETRQAKSFDESQFQPLESRRLAEKGTEFPFASSFPHSEEESLFIEFMRKHERFYSSQEEYDYRLAVFS